MPPENILSQGEFYQLNRQRFESDYGKKAHDAGRYGYLKYAQSQGANLDPDEVNTYIRSGGNLNREQRRELGGENPGTYNITRPIPQRDIPQRNTEGANFSSLIGGAVYVPPGAPLKQNQSYEVPPTIIPNLYYTPASRYGYTSEKEGYIQYVLVAQREVPPIQKINYVEVPKRQIKNVNLRKEPPQIGSNAQKFEYELNQFQYQEEFANRYPSSVYASVRTNQVQQEKIQASQPARLYSMQYPQNDAYIYSPQGAGINIIQQEELNSILFAQSIKKSISSLSPDPVIPDALNLEATRQTYLLGAGFAPGVISAFAPFTDPKKFIGETLGYTSEVLYNPIQRAKDTISELSGSFYSSPAYFAGNVIGQTVVLEGAGKFLAKVNQPKDITIKLTGKEFVQKGIAGSGEEVSIGTSQGVIRVPSFGRVGEILYQKLPFEYKSESIFYTKIPFTASYKKVVGNPSSLDFFNKISEELAPPKKTKTTKPISTETVKDLPENIIGIRGFDKSLQSDIPSQAELLQKQLDMPLSYIESGEIVVGKFKPRSFGATLNQTTNDILSVIEKDAKAFPKDLVQRQAVASRKGEIGYVIKLGEAGEGVPKTTTKFFLEVPIRKTKTQNFLKDLTKGVSSYEQSLKSVKTEAGLNAGFERISSLTTSKFPLNKRTNITVEENILTIGEKGTKTNILENFLGGKTKIEIDAALEQAKQFSASKGNLNDIFKPKKIEELPNTIPTNTGTVQYLKEITTKLDDKKLFSIQRPSAATYAAKEILLEDSLKLSKEAPLKGFTTNKNNSVLLEKQSSDIKTFQSNAFQKQISLSESKARQIFNPLTRVSQGQLTELNVNTVSIQSNKTINESISLTRTLNLTQSVPLNKIKEKLLNETQTNTVTQTILKQQEITRQITRTIQETIQKQTTRVPTFIRPPPKTPKFLKPLTRNKFFGKLPAQKGFLVQIFRSGKPFKTLNSSPLIEREAIAFGANFVNNSIKASFRLVEAGAARAKGIKGDVSILRRGKRNPYLFVEKSQFRINTAQEKASLKAARLFRNKGKGFF